MKNYLFETITVMKEYNSKNYWINDDIIKDVEIEAENLKEALKEYQEHAANNYITISNTALKTKKPMYIDKKSGDVEQVGYVITGSTEIEKSDYTTTKQYIDLWVSIKILENADF